MGFLLILKALVSTCTCGNLIQDEPLKEAIYVLFKEVVLVSCGAMVVQALNYYGLLRLNKELALGACYCILMSIALWTILGITMTVAA